MNSYEVVPKSSVVISRVAYQNNTSKYFINNKASNASDVTTLLRKRGIDLDNNRFLILQGEVEQELLFAFLFQLFLKQRCMLRD